MIEAEFEWSRLGNIETGRGNLGSEAPVEMYRLLQYTIFDELSNRFDDDTAENIYRSAGFRAGLAFSRNIMEKKEDFYDFISECQEKLRSMKIGILRIEKADLDNLELMLSVSEDLDCSGLPLQENTVCVYDEGFLAGILFDYTGEHFDVKEVDCWATGDRTCRFDARVIR
ncbi:MAG: 4-vinyl reductase [Peptococcaceae bacterium]|nr:4-vinyl reductase [Peptococcaceae bacterium]